MPSGAKAAPRPWEKTTPISAAAPLVYHLARLIFKVAFFCSMKTRFIGLEKTHRRGGYLLACTHLSHLEPLCLSVWVDRRIDWMTRREFYRHRIAAWFLRMIDTFEVNRQGISVKTIRTGIERARMGRVVGVCPEGGVTLGALSACRGGPIKHGSSMIACHAGVPIIPCVVLGTHTLNRVVPWLPIKQGRLWVIFGDPIFPRPAPPGRAAARQRRAHRAAMSAELQAAFKSLYEELLQQYGIEDQTIP